MKQNMMYVVTPSTIPALGYYWHENGILETRISVAGKVIKREFSRPSKKHRRRIGRRIRRGWKIDNEEVHSSMT